MYKSASKTLSFLVQAFALSLLAAASLGLLVTLIHIARLGWASVSHLGMLGIRPLVETVLDGFVLLELIRSFADYLESRRLHVSLLLETALVFVLREMSSGLYVGHTNLPLLVGYAIIILALLAGRAISCKFDCISD